MKHFLFIFLFIHYCISSFGQVAAAVYDARNDINMTNQYLLGLKDFGEVKQQTQILTNTYDFYKKAQEALQKINRAVSDFYKIQEIVKNQVESIKFYGYYTSQVRGFTHVSKAEITSFTSLLSSFNQNINELFKHAQLILKPDYFKMSDAERLHFLSDIDSQMTENKTLMSLRYKKIKAREDDLAVLQFFKRI